MDKLIEVPKVTRKEVCADEEHGAGTHAGLDNGVIKRPGKKVRLGSFADLVADGENSRGLMVQTPNGTSRQDHKQNDRAYNYNTDRWTKNEDWDGDMSGN